METTATVTATTNYAGFGHRLGALLIDAIILSILNFVVIVPILGAVGLGAASAIENGEQLTEAEALGMAGGIMAAVGTAYLGFFIIQILYFAIMESSKTQGSVGKMALGIKVTDMNGERLTFGKALVRSLGKILSSMIMCIGYLMAAFTEKKQGLHDMIAGTLVLKK